MTILTASASTSVLGYIANSAVRALALSGVVGLGLAAFRVKTTAVRLFTWTAVLYAAFAMPLLQWVLPRVTVPLPAVLQLEAEQSRAGKADFSATESAVLPHQETARTAPTVHNSNEATTRHST